MFGLPSLGAFPVTLHARAGEPSEAPGRGHFYPRLTSQKLPLDFSVEISV